MVLRKLSQGFKITLALMLSVLSSGILQTVPVYAHNDGTVHEHGNPTPGPDPKVFVCKYVGTPFVNETLQTGDNPISVSANSTGGATVGRYFADQQGQSFVLAVDDTAPGPAGDPSVSACPAPRTPATPTASAVGSACVPVGQSTGSIIVTVTNTDDATNAAVTYSVTLNAVTVSTGSVADGAQGTATFNNLAAGVYPFTASGSDGTSTSGSATLSACTVTPLPAQPSALAATLPCEPGDTTTDVTVTVTNTDDDTNVAVTYSVTMGGQTLSTGSVADGATGTVTFSGLAAGAYTASVTGSDTTTATSNSVTVTECGGRGGGDKVTICHATSSASNPYEKITVDTNAADGGGENGDHFDEHKGPIFNPLTNKSGDKWGDIIPPIEGAHSGLNWTTEGRAIYDNNCNVPAPQPVANIAATVVCVPTGVKVTLTNTGNASGSATVNGTVHTVAAGATKEVVLGFDAGTPFMAVVTITIGNSTTTQTVNCAPGQGAGQVLGSTTTTPQVLGTTAELPAALPATGGEQNPLMIILASLIAYGAAYFLQGRRQLNQNRA